LQVRQQSVVPIAIYECCTVPLTVYALCSALMNQLLYEQIRQLSMLLIAIMPALCCTPIYFL
jgi:hypothetical protein